MLPGTDQGQLSLSDFGRVPSDEAVRKMLGGDNNVSREEKIAAHVIAGLEQHILCRPSCSASETAKQTCQCSNIIEHYFKEPIVHPVGLNASRLWF